TTRRPATTRDAAQAEAREPETLASNHVHNRFAQAWDVVRGAQDDVALQPPCFRHLVFFAHDRHNRWPLAPESRNGGVRRVADAFKRNAPDDRRGRGRAHTETFGA